MYSGLSLSSRSFDDLLNTGNRGAGVKPPKELDEWGVEFLIVNNRIAELEKFSVGKGEEAAKTVAEYCLKYVCTNEAAVRTVLEKNRDILNAAASLIQAENGSPSEEAKVLGHCIESILEGLNKIPDILPLYGLGRGVHKHFDVDKKPVGVIEDQHQTCVGENLTEELSSTQKDLLQKIKSGSSHLDGVGQLFSEFGPISFCEFLCNQIDAKRLSPKQVVECFGNIVLEKEKNECVQYFGEIDENKEKKDLPTVYRVLKHAGDDQQIIKSLCKLLNRLDDKSMIKLLTFNAPSSTSSAATLDYLLREGSDLEWRRFTDLMPYVKERIGVEGVECVLGHSGKPSGLETRLDLVSLLSIFKGGIPKTPIGRAMLYDNDFAISMLMRVYSDCGFSSSRLVKEFDCFGAVKTAIDLRRGKGVAAYCKALQSVVSKFDEKQKSIVLAAMRDAELVSLFGKWRKKSDAFVSLCKENPGMYDLYKATKESLKH